MKLRHAASAAAVILALVSAAPLAAQSQAGGAEAEIRALLDSSAAAWNRGDVRGHLATNTDSIWFMTRRGPVVGNDSILEMFSKRYFAEGQTRQALRFDHVSVRPLGERHALAVGQFILTGGEQAEQSGWFTTVWERRAEGWRVIHDHSS